MAAHYCDRNRWSNRAVPRRRLTQGGREWVRVLLYSQVRLPGGEDP